MLKHVYPDPGKYHLEGIPIIIEVSPSEYSLDIPSYGLCRETQLCRWAFRIGTKKLIQIVEGVGGYNGEELAAWERIYAQVF